MSILLTFSLALGYYSIRKNKQYIIEDYKVEKGIYCFDCSFGDVYILKVNDFVLKEEKDIAVLDCRTDKDPDMEIIYSCLIII